MPTLDHVRVRRRVQQLREVVLHEAAHRIGNDGEVAMSRDLVRGMEASARHQCHASPRAVLDVPAGRAFARDGRSEDHRLISG